MIRANSRANYMPPELTPSPLVEVDTDRHPATVPVAIECHYCGYEPPAGRKGRICPKCGGSSWEPVMPEETIPDAEDVAAVAGLGSTRSRFDDLEDGDDGFDLAQDVDMGREEFDASATVTPGPCGSWTRFHVGCPAQQVYLVAFLGGGQVRVVPMHRVARRTWELTLPDPSGLRAFLYLIDDGQDLIERRPSSL